ncbi:class I SAM-dependent methyltransferase [Rhizosphaericola mali]|uniref:Methyltransferase domain-containing protein n=1 Tax=Rhizosphaericola mali TaxID=2545455 RepID=A0A5P2G348_9BACT|nr:methyltransferase domain-containing protein [Rhizosphaericola mali]QES87533.1 methyltransferase domain-containing protein [Rhizosphaericola mali]
MFEFHGDRKRYFDIQIVNCREYVLPFVEQVKKMQPSMRVLEIGCGEGGVLQPFLEKGCDCVGVEFDTSRTDNAAIWMKEFIDQGKLQIIPKDIYLVDADALGGKFDLIILKDVIEHIHDQAKLMARMQHFLKVDGYIFFGFPPWQMPFGGHQQICHNKWLSKLPYYHLLPMPIYKSILKKYGENVEEMVEIKETGISIERFEKISKDAGYKIAEKTHFLINPIYKWKFGWEAKKQLPIVKDIPWVRNFFTTCVYYMITPK